MFDAPMDWLIIIVVALIIFGGTKRYLKWPEILERPQGNIKEDRWR